MKMRRHERGAALLTAMVIVTLVATLAAAMVWQHWRAVQAETIERSRIQSAWILSGALDWAPRFRDAIKPVMEWLYLSVKSGNEAQISIDSNSKPDYREKLNEELRQMRESEMWQAGATVRKLRPENN